MSPDLPGQGKFFTEDLDDDGGLAAIRGAYLPGERRRRRLPPKPRKCRTCGRTGGNEWAAADLCNGCVEAAKGGGPCGA